MPDGGGQPGGLGLSCAAVIGQHSRLRAGATAARVRGGGALRLLGDLDQALLVRMRTRGHTPASERIGRALGWFGEWGAGWIAIAAAGAGIDRSRREGWLAAAGVGPGAILINYAAKLAVGRERPLLPDHPWLGRAPSKLSFPSAHATSSMAAAVTMGRLAPAGRPTLYGLAGAVALSRPFLGMHYPSDVLAGVALGAAIGCAWPLPRTRPPTQVAAG